MRSFLWYLTFVGIPLLATLIVLQLGERLSAPHAVHGVYAAAFDSSGNGPCLADLMAASPSEIALSQSGTHVTVAVGGAKLIGTLSGDSLRAVSPRRGSSLPTGGCLTVDTLRMEAVSERDADQKHLVGRLFFPGCERCRPVPFRAIRSDERSRTAGD